MPVFDSWHATVDEAKHQVGVRVQWRGLNMGATTRMMKRPSSKPLQPTAFGRG